MIPTRYGLFSVPSAPSCSKELPDATRQPVGQALLAVCRPCQFTALSSPVAIGVHSCPFVVGRLGSGYEGRDAYNQTVPGNFFCRAGLSLG